MENDYINKTPWFIHVIRWIILILIIFLIVDGIFAYNISYNDYKENLVIEQGSANVSYTDYKEYFSVGEDIVGNISFTDYKECIGFFCKTSNLFPTIEIPEFPFGRHPIITVIKEFVNITDLCLLNSKIKDKVLILPTEPNIPTSDIIVETSSPLTIKILSYLFVIECGSIIIKGVRLWWIFSLIVLVLLIFIVKRIIIKRSLENQKFKERELKELKII